MSIARRDYILRLIEQFAQALGRMMGLRKAGKLDEAEELVNATADGIFGSLRSMLDKVDASTAAGLLSSFEKIVVYAAITGEQAEIAASRGDVQRAQGRRRRALELYLEASRLGELDTRSRADVDILQQSVDMSRLETRYREWLQRLAHAS